MADEVAQIGTVAFVVNFNAEAIIATEQPICETQGERQCNEAMARAFFSASKALPRVVLRISVPVHVILSND